MAPSYYPLENGSKIQGSRNFDPRKTDSRIHFKEQPVSIFPPIISALSIRKVTGRRKIGDIARLNAKF